MNNTLTYAQFLSWANEVTKIKIEQEMGLRIMLASMVVIMLGGGLYGWNVIGDTLFYIITWGFSITLILGFVIYITTRFIIGDKRPT